MYVGFQRGLTIPVGSDLKEALWLGGTSMGVQVLSFQALTF